MQWLGVLIIRASPGLFVVLAAALRADIISAYTCSSCGLLVACVTHHTALIQVQLQYLARQSRATHKGARGSWGTWNKTLTRQNAIKKLANINVVTTLCRRPPWRLSSLQVHPTGFVDPADPTAGTKVSTDTMQVYYTNVVVHTLCH